MSADLIITAASIITMDPAAPRAQALAVDTESGQIAAVGSLDECISAAPHATREDLADTVLMPGFIDAHNHPVLSGIATQEPAYWIAPHCGYPTFADVEALFRKVNADLPAGQPVLANGLDRLLQGAPDLSRAQLDEYFPDRAAAVIDNSGHEAYFNTKVVEMNGWDGLKPPPDPKGGTFGRLPDGTSDGRAYEASGLLAAIGKLLAAAVPHPLLSAARWYALMARNGVTATTEHTYEKSLLDAYIALSSADHCPLRVALYHMSIDDGCGDQLTTPISDEILWKQGVKLWADGSPWVGTMASSFPYLDTETTRAAQIPLGPAGESALNYTRVELDEVLAPLAPDWQMAFHVNGDVGIDIVLDSYEQALASSGRLGTDHRWRIEHCGAARGDQFERAAALGVCVSLLPAQFYYWGDLLDGKMFPTEIGGQWQRGGDAVRSGISFSFHNDGSVSPPLPLVNIQAMVTRRSSSGTLHGPEQTMGIDDALRAHTVNAAFQIGRDHDLGSLTKGRLADLVGLSADPFSVDPHRLAADINVTGTWHGGRKVDLDAFIDEIEKSDPTSHEHLAHRAAERPVCSHAHRH